MSRKKKPSRKRLTYFEGSIYNKYNVEFTDQEAKNLKNLVDSASRKRRNLLKKEGELIEFFGGVSHKKPIKELSGLMGKESDFILAKKSRSLNRFRSHKEFENYIENLRDVVSRDYIPRKVEQYRENQIKSLKSVFNSKANKLIDMIRSMNTDEYMKAVQQDEALEISYTSPPIDTDKKYKIIEKALKSAIKRTS